MYSIQTFSPVAGHRFRAVLTPFLQQPGLPFADVLSAEDVRRAFAQRDGLFAQNDIFSTPVVLWAFLAQTLRDGKGAACAAAVADIATYTQQIGAPCPCGDTGDYCRARAKLNLHALRQLTRDLAERMEQQARPHWLWHGHHAKLFDGFTVTMPDTPANRRQFPKRTRQRPGTGFPIARGGVILSLATAGILDLQIGPYQGKQTGENALLRNMLDAFKPGDVAVFDRYLCSFLQLAMFHNRGVHFCCRLHQRRPVDFRTGKRLGKDDQLVTWTRPARPQWMAPQRYAQIPETLTLRQIRYHVTQPGRRTETLTVVTSLIDPKQYPRQEIAQLYGYRWNAELDIRVIKQTLGLDHLRCKTPDAVRRELWVTLLAYNLIRRLIATAAAVHGKQPRQLGFTRACQEVLAASMLLATGACRDPEALWRGALQRIAANEVANRPGRIEPRTIKRTHDRYPRMKEPRETLRRKLA